MDSRLVWMILDTCGAFFKASLAHCCTEAPQDLHFRVVTMTWMNGWTNSPVPNKAFLPYAARKALGSAKIFLQLMLLPSKSVA